jgi:predicted RNase H-like HicB family nuclease
MAKIPAVLQIKIELSGGMYYVSSEDVPGLHMAGSDAEKLARNLAPAIKCLMKANKGYDVEIHPPIGVDSFPRATPAQFTTPIPEQLLMYKAAA